MKALFNRLPLKYIAIFFVLFCGIIIGTVVTLSVSSAKANTSVTISNPDDTSPTGVGAPITVNGNQPPLAPTIDLGNGCIKQGSVTICSNQNNPSPTQAPIDNSNANSQPPVVTSAPCK